MAGTAPHRLHPAQPGLDRMSVGSVAAFHVKQQARLSRQDDPELAARASGLSGLGFAARSLIGLATALEACDHPAAPESDAGSSTAARTSQHHPAQGC
ncbi:hypothetical protein [Micromonospora sp. WMMB235]|uniref:hypothetical protein n=1 Tax=Micromonospora sp. WMMB235 TaxID=1172030 RepID=UPI000916258A|nr:hypothetical protein [Micromonospora sp. WMMB235]OHX05017.1 hypothetical protein BFV98_19540 [Micromonospora sp. WMMB235]